VVRLLLPTKAPLQPFFSVQRAFVIGFLRAKLFAFGAIAMKIECAHRRHGSLALRK
jgi:hypothetical protein